MKAIKSKLTLLMTLLIALLFLAPLATAQTGSLRVWENIADGTLTSDWFENDDLDWKGQNESGIWAYNFTDTELGWANNYTYDAPRWFQTYEVYDTSDAETGVGVLNVIDDTRWYGVIYYMSFNNTNPECYVIYYNTSEIYYLNNGVGWDTNISNATDFSGNCEIDYLTGEPARIKALWNWNIDDGTSNCSVRFKIWSPSDDEPQTWMVDTNITQHDLDPWQGIAYDYYPGVVVDHSYDLDPTTTLLRRIFFWDLAYDRYIAPTVPYISCPQYSIGDFIAWQESVDDIDFWNYTQAYKTMINSWDLTSFYEFNDPSKTDAQNDTIYVFSVMFTDILDYWEELSGDEWTYDAVFPNNMLVFYIYNPTDGTYGSAEDFCRIRFDFDLDGYDETDFTSTITGDDDWFYYRGWTDMIGDEEFYGFAGAVEVDDDDWGYNFRDKDYAGYVVMLNWDLISDNMDVGNVVNLSISFYDNASSEYCVWQDWDETTDLPDGSPSDNATWQENEWNTTTYWGLLGITGDALDFEDPEEPVEIPKLSDTFEDVGLGALGYLLVIVIVMAFLLSIWAYMTSVKSVGINEIKNGLIMILIMVVIVGVILTLI